MVRRASRERSAPVPFPKTLTVPVLEGELVRLEPLDHRHAADLAVAAEENRSSYQFTWVPTAAQVGDYIDAQLARRAAGTLAPYAQLAKATGRTVGATAYWDPRLWPDRDELCAVEVGFTWLAASAQGTGLNTEAKFLLFAHAFEQWQVARVDLKTDAATTAPVRRSNGWERDSRAYCAAGRGLGRLESRGCYGTPRCIPFSPRNGQPAGLAWRHAHEKMTTAEITAMATCRMTGRTTRTSANPVTDHWPCCDRHQ
jgi:N-acetyltransferase